MCFGNSLHQGVIIMAEKPIPVWFPVEFPDHPDIYPVECRGKLSYVEYNPSSGEAYIVVGPGEGRLEGYAMKVFMEKYRAFGEKNKEDRQVLES